MAAREFGPLYQPESLNELKYPVTAMQGRGDFTPLPANHNKSTEWSPYVRSTVSNNYLRTYMHTPEPVRMSGEQFFPNWHDDAEHIGGILGKGVEHGAAVLAHFSPSNEAELNRIQGIQFAQLHSSGYFGDERMGHLRNAAESASIAKSYQSQANAATKQGDHGRAAKLMEHHEIHKAASESYRDMVGLGKTPLSGIASSDLLNGIGAVNSETPLETLRNSKGWAMKKYHFGHNIVDPYNYPVPTIDTHAHDAGVGRIDIPYETSRGLDTINRPVAFQDSLSAAHRRYGRMAQRGGQEMEGFDPDISLGSFMGGLWMGHLQRKVAFNPDARRARASTETRLQNIRENPANAPFLPGRGDHGDLLPSFGKIWIPGRDD